MSATLCLHAGGKLVSRDELYAVEPVEGTDTWFPTAHSLVLDIAEKMLSDAGFEIERAQYALANDGHRFFGTLDLTSPIVEGV